MSSTTPDKQMQRLKKIYQASTIFTPSAPVDDYNLFAGRVDQVHQVVTAVGQKGQHAIIFGERGVGKTSLANILHHFIGQFAPSKGTVVKVNCDGNSKSSSIWKTVFRELLLIKEKPTAGFQSQKEVEQVSLGQTVPDEVSPEDVRYHFQRLPAGLVVIIDEVDRIKDKRTLASLADTVKTLSDHAVSATIVLVGVADSVDTLIAEHRSIERALIQVRMPRMSESELHEILDKGFSKLGMRIEKPAKEQIARLSQGLPHYTHLLGLCSAKIAIQSDSKAVGKHDVRAAISEAVKQAHQSMVSGYTDAVSSPRGNLYQQVLLACALARVDATGFFSSVDVREPLSRVMKQKYEIAAFSRHLNDFCAKERGPILEKRGYRRRYRFRFVNPLIQPYVIMKGLADGMLTEELWDLS